MFVVDLLVLHIIVLRSRKVEEEEEKEKEVVKEEGKFKYLCNFFVKSL